MDIVWICYNLFTYSRNKFLAKANAQLLCVGWVEKWEVYLKVVPEKKRQDPNHGLCLLRSLDILLRAVGVLKGWDGGCKETPTPSLVLKGNLSL